MPGTPARLTALLAAECFGVVMWERAPPRAATALGLIGAALVLRRSPRHLRALGGLLLMATLGWTSAAIAGRETAIARAAHDIPTCTVQGRIAQVTALGTFVAVTSADCDNEILTRSGSVVIPDEGGEPGAPVTAVGPLIPLRDEGFDRMRADAGADAYLHARAVTTGSVPLGPHAVAARIRSGLDGAVAGLPQQTAAMIQGASIGETSRFSETTLERFRRSGLAHVLAVSGTNVAIVLGALLVTLRGVGEKLRSIAGAAGIGLFVLVVGPEASVLRAATMAAISLLALLSGRRADPLRALLVALLVLIALQPGLVRSVGLHLSAAATAGIVLFASPLARRLTRLPEQIALPVAAGGAAQIAVAPLLATTFGSLPIAGLIANLVALPAVAPVTILGLCAACAGAVYVPAGRLLARLAQPFAAWIVFVARTMGSWSWASVEVAPTFGIVLGVPIVAAALWIVWGRE